MKNVILITTITCLTLFASCTKESSYLSEALPMTDVHSENVKKRMNQPNTAEVDAQSPNGQSTIEVELVQDETSQSAPELLIDYIMEDENALEASSVKVEQQLTFTGADETTITLDFNVDRHSVQNDTLRIVYLLEGQSVNNLELMDIQDVIIEDIVIN